MPAYTVGIDLGGTKIAAARFDDDFNILDKTQVPTPHTAEEIPDSVIGAARAVWDRDVIAVGAGVAGLIRWPEGVLAWVPHVRGAGVPLRARLAESLGVPVVVDHDANAAALAEFEIGSGRGYPSGLLVTVGTGIGGGFIIEGEIYRGRSFAGEVGHMRVEAEGLECPCGATGCWETMASGSALARLAREEVRRAPDGLIARIADGAHPKGEHVTEAARQGDPAAMALIEEIGRWLGIGLANLIAAFDPGVLIVGGGLVGIGELLLEPTRMTVRERLYGAQYRPVTPILGSAFGAEAGLVGAGLLAWRESSWRFRMRERTRKLTEGLRTGEI